MFGVCLRYSSSKEDAEDILHDGFLKVFEKVSQYGFKGSFEGWMRRIVVNTALEKYRQQFKVIRIQDSLSYSQTESYDNLMEMLTEKELLELVRGLSPKYRMVFNMYAIEGYTHKEIADHMKISEGTSKSNLSRAKAILQDKVKSLYQVESKQELT